MYYASCISFELCASHSGCLSPCLSFHSFPPFQDIFPPKCAAYVGSMSVSSCPSPHHHHTLDALWLSLQRSAWRHQWVLWLWSQVRGQCAVLLSAEIKVYLNGLTFVARPTLRLCRGPDAGSEVCFGHCLWNGLFTHAWTDDPSSLSQQQECHGENKNSFEDHPLVAQQRTALQKHVTCSHR